MKNKLLPCPFCGSESSHVIGIPDRYIMCYHCLTEGPVFNSDEEAIAAWNTRANNWISVKDRLPPIYTNVLAFCFEDYIQEAYLMRIDEYDDEDDVPIFKSDVTERFLTVTHWMPLPEPSDTGKDEG